MGTEIYYFSGTGNSLFVARELQKRIPDCQLVPLVSLLGLPRVRSTATTVGFVFPVHALTIPVAVKWFVRDADFSSAEYLFAVATRVGTVFRGFGKMDRLLRRQGRQLNAHFVLNMCNNEARHESYQVPSEEDLRRVEREVLKRLNVIQACVNERMSNREQDRSHTIDFSHNPVQNFFSEKLVLLGMEASERVGGVNYFYADEKCVGCGLCERVCLSGKIVMQNGQPVWSKQTFCYMCFACLNYCPHQAVQISDIPGVKSSTVTNGRYPHPYATVAEIAAQKQVVPPARRGEQTE